MTSENFDTLYHFQSNHTGKGRYLSRKNIVNYYYDREPAEYFDALKFHVTPEELQGKTILDIGSGVTEKFGRMMRL